MDSTPFQEYDCPVSGIDFDLIGDEILCAGERRYCSGCGGHHTAGVDGPIETGMPNPQAAADGVYHAWRGLPKDAAEKAEWIAEALRAAQSPPQSLR